MKNRIVTIILCILPIFKLWGQEDSTAWANSLWLNWQDNNTDVVDMFMVDFYVNTSAKSTYYAALNFTGGYGGIQDVQSDDLYRTIHFSLWDKTDGQPGEMAEVVWKGTGVGSSRFGGEGEGVKTWFRFNWVEWEPYRMVVKLWNDTEYSYRDAWFYDFRTDKWKHIATLRRPGKEYFHNNGSFIEDWARTGENYRSYTLYNMCKRYFKGKKWFTYSKAEYWINGINPNCNAKVINNKQIQLESGGIIPPPRTPNYTVLEVEPAQIKVEAPRIDEIDVEKTDSTTIEVSWTYSDNLWASQETCRLRIAQDETFITTVYESGTQNTNDPVFSISDLQLDSLQTYFLRLDVKNIFDMSSNKIVPIKNYSLVGLEKQPRFLPEEPVLKQNYPNPLNPGTTMQYVLPASGRVSLKIYNVNGRLLKTLIEQDQPGGSYSMSWDGKDDSGHTVASGVYVSSLSWNGYTKTSKMIVIK